MLDGAPPTDPEWSAGLDLYRDLNLDQVIAAVVDARAEYDLRPFYLRPLADRDAIAYRQAVFRDLERADVQAGVRAFCERMVSMRAHLERAGKGGYEYQHKRWLLHAAAEYCEAVLDLADLLAAAPIAAAGLQRLDTWLADYTAGPGFRSLNRERSEVETGLAAITYLIDIRGDRVRVERFHGEPNYGAAVARTFEKFRERDAYSHLYAFADHDDMDHVEGQVLEAVAQLFATEFGALDRFCAAHPRFADATVLRFDREAQFYLAYLDHIRPLRSAGLAFSYPDVAPDVEREHAADTFDLALAGKLVGTSEPVVTNDFELAAGERVFVVTGPNQGGKTTFARTFGQLHYLARLGLPVPGRDVRLLLCDRIYTHFERPENLHDLVGKLQDDLLRIREILDRATRNSVVIMNEIFTSTTLQDARYLSREVLARLRAADALCVCVTFIDELATFDEATVSVVSSVVPNDPAVRTFKVVRKAADGRAYARVLADRYALTYDAIRERVGR